MVFRNTAKNQRKVHMMNIKNLKPIALGTAASVLFILSVSGADKPKRVPSPPGAKVYVVSPKDGETVPRKFKVIFGLSGMGVCPAGITGEGGVPIPDTGHHHMCVDQATLPPMDDVLPIDQPDKVLHYGKGQTETMLELAPGRHTLQLIFADYAHVPHDPPVVSEKITVIVKE